jgi:hypothetical protein
LADSSIRHLAEWNGVVRIHSETLLVLLKETKGNYVSDRPLLLAPE